MELILEPVNDSVYVTWNIVFSGEALLSVHTTNSCGDSPESEALTITVNQAPSPAIVGEQTVCSDDEEIYSTEDNTGSTYIWEIEGGTISSGAGTNEIMVLWGEPGEGWLTVTEENTFGCISTTEEFMVTIDECTNIDEKNSNSVLIFPNPATTYINIELAGKITALKEIIITNSFGTNIQTIPCTGNASSRYIFSTSEFAGGLYYVRVVTVNNDIATGKFMVINH